MAHPEAVSVSNNLYLERYAWQHHLFPDYQPDPKLGLIVVIPSYKESGLLMALQALNQCTPPQQKVLILLVVNESEDAEEAIRKINEQTLRELSSYDSKYELLFARVPLPPKKAGVGLARKIGMDEAVRFFEKIGKDGVIICYDADCLCEANYLSAIEKAYRDARTNAGIVFYEHRLNGENQEAIIQYELYLRYYIDALRFAGFPYAHQTLGSCITVRSSVYQKQGGMNTRKAGEDFYFLNKVIPLGGFLEINDTTIYPSDRVSDRVPFGTGKAIDQMLQDAEDYQVYNPQSFEHLKVLFNQVEDIWSGNSVELPLSIQYFLGNDWEELLIGVKSQTASFDTFTDRFFKWFDAFKILKFVHFARDHYHPNVPVEEALDWQSSKVYPLNGTLTEMLQQLREFDRSYKA